MTVTRRAMLVSVLPIAGCSTTSPTDPSLGTTARGAACCSSASSLSFQKYSAEKLFQLAVSDESPSLPFSTGSAKCIGIELALPFQPNALEFLTYREGFFVPTATVFVPTFDFLDASYQTLATVEPRVYQDTDRLSQKKGFMQAYYGAALVPPSAKYVLVYTNAQKLDTHGVQIIQGGGLEAAYILSRDREFYARLSRKDFASGRVNPPSTNPGTRTISRSRLGAIAIVFGRD